MGELPPSENQVSDLTNQDSKDSNHKMEPDVNTDLGEVSCICEKHEGKEVFNHVYSFSVDHFFGLMFTASKFLDDLFVSRKTYDVVRGEWELEEETGDKTRQLMYTLTLNNPMAKSSRSTDQQRMSKHCKPGQFYMISTEIINAGVPYSDSFSLRSQYCITRVSNQESRMRVHVFVHYRKSVWGLVKSLIEKSAMQDVHDFYGDLDVALKKEVGNGQQTPGKKSRTSKPSKSQSQTPSIQGPALLTTRSAITTDVPPSRGPATGTGISNSSTERIVTIILGTLFTMMLLNGLLFYKLWALEDVTVKLTSIPDKFQIPIDNQNYSPENCPRVLKHQEVLHTTEAHKWDEAITDIIKLLGMTVTSLSDLKRNMGSYSSYVKSVTQATAPQAVEESKIETKT